jgi:hypothetical protein
MGLWVASDRFAMSVRLPLSGITTLAQFTRARGGAERRGRRGPLFFFANPVGGAAGVVGARAQRYGVAVDDRLIAPGRRWQR